jgi:hypothetical protein
MAPLEPVRKAGHGSYRYSQERQAVLIERDALHAHRFEFASAPIHSDLYRFTYGKDTTLVDEFKYGF